jgi:hypothetical protein
MKCLRCGYCCKHLCVIIVNDPKLGIQDGNLELHPGEGKPCKHLIGNSPGNYSCAIHNEPWYKKTPCFSHGQIEQSPNDECRMGKYILSKVPVVSLSKE